MFQYANSLNLNMRYYHIQISEETSNLCKIILPWGKYRYKHLTMGVSNLTYISNRKLTIYSKDLNISMLTYMKY